MKKLSLFKAVLLVLTLTSFIPKPATDSSNSWIRINLLGYQPSSSKVAIWASKTNQVPDKFELINQNGKVVYTSTNIKSFGAYGPFTATARLNFSDFKTPGKYFIRIAEIKSPEININDEVYRHTADFALRYMRQQRSGFNPYLRDSCHTHDGYVLYGAKAGIKDSTYMDASGGWHDASDYLQYSTTSANATYHLLMAYRDFPQAFGDEKQANGLEGKNGRADVLDEAKWGLDWLLKMHPKENIMFNQLADDRDHLSMRIPKEDSQYGKGFERPLYYIDGEPQQRGKFMNNTKGTSSTAAKFTSAFALGSKIFASADENYAQTLAKKAMSALAYANIKKGVTQTVSVKSPYIYAEDNWVDDMELAYASIPLVDSKSWKKNAKEALSYAKMEPITPWLTRDTANHYQYYPFVNIGHYELSKLNPLMRQQLTQYYKQGIEQVWDRAKKNAFYRGVPFIWCSNNLTVAFTQQCMWYKNLSGDKSFTELEQANFDWIFGCNPWGTSMVYGLPNGADTPTDPHSAFTHLKKYPIDGGLVDGPVYTNIYKNLIGIQLGEPDEYAEFQSDLAVYHDDYGDYSTNEPTMDGTASLIYLLAAYDSSVKTIPKEFQSLQGAIIRGKTTEKKIALVFTGDEFADGGESINKTLVNENVKASFFLTGRFYSKAKFASLIKTLKANGNYLGPHSNGHLLYNDWTKRDSLLVTELQFKSDLIANYSAMEKFGIKMGDAKYFLPPYEWYNQQIANWTSQMDKQLVNFTSGTRSNADYTYPEMGKAYRSSDEIYKSILDYDKSNPNGLNGFILLLHIGTDPRRTDKFYNRLPELIKQLKNAGYELVTINNLLKEEG
ncbi:glycoside hydrolase family 9 protein [Pedobacter boryungensis]|uniref:Glycoside hydrolase family 9 protein n=1 Tax=Pedobacter boryungensis TaxID=869962 RepID=A0ABX2DDC1_9SPHI|nr:glycoside hydrolase family 9 protein [Pedobacter boryungensis]NQX31433.1 glycoside hydrolase family 9 protein [Pedobacter boryungensis]